MFKTRFWVLMLALLVALSATLAVTACGGDDDDDDDDDTGDDDTGDDDTGDDDTGGDTLTGFVRTFPQREPVADITVEILDHETGDPFDPAITATSGADGSVSFEVPAGVAKVAVRTTGLNYTDTMQYDFARDAQDEEFLIVANTTLEFIATLIETPIQDGLTHMAGAVYWGDPTDETPVGCAEVTITPDTGDAPTVFYGGADELPSPARGNTHPDNAVFVGVNSPVSGATFSATTATDATASVSIPKTYADTVVIQNIYFSKDDYANDTDLEPADCE